jgi:DNA polymerase (family 10)
MENIEIASILDEIADLIEIQDGNPFRVRAYRTAARTIGTVGTPVATLIKTGPAALEALPGIGADLAGKIATICRTGTLPLLAQLTRKTPAGVVALLRIPGIGPKRARLIYRRLGVKTLTQLGEAARAGRLAALPGLGKATEQAILRGLAQERAHGGRMRLAEAEALVRPLLEHLRRTRGVEAVDVAGSLRRRAETVGDVDILVASAHPAAAARAFLGFDRTRRVLARGDTRCSVVLSSGLQVDLRVVPKASYGAALHYFTGSKLHNIAVRRLGVRRRLKINE